MNHEMVDSIQNRKKRFTVDYTGFGWVMIRKGVFENEQMKYPWFAPKMQVFESESCSGHVWRGRFILSRCY